MTIDPTSRPSPNGPVPNGPAAPPQTLEEAARQFEAILAGQFVRVMTDGLFDESLAGEGGPGWMSGQRDTQRDLLSGILADHLVDSGALRLSDLLLRQWQGTTAPTLPAADPAPDALVLGPSIRTEDDR